MNCKPPYIILLLMLISGAERIAAKSLPGGVEFHFDTIERKGVYGDNWCQTWSSDDNIYTFMDDGSGWKSVRHEIFREGSLCLQIQGGPDFTDDQVSEMSGWPKSDVRSPLYAYGTISVEGVLYVWVWKSDDFRGYSRPVANRLLYSPDLGRTFFRWNGEIETTDTFGEFRPESFFFYKEDPRMRSGKETYAFNWIAFCQSGRDNALAKDDFVYMYAPEQHDPRDLAVIRVRKEHIRDRSEYAYFKGWNGETPEWTAKMSERGVNLRYPENRSDGEWMWASWFPDVVYNPGLDLYIMTSYGVTDPGKSFWGPWCWQCSYPASLGFWYAEHPWGPWTRFYYTEYFYADDPENRTYGFKLSPKWISEDGRTMYLIWSDARDNHETNYNWNQMKITFPPGGE